MFARTSSLLILSTCLFLVADVSAEAYEISADSIYKHVSVLASDSLEGREIGEPGEMKAAHYIESVFRRAGLEPAGDSGSYLQAIEFVKGIATLHRTNLTVNGTKLTMEKQFQPFLQSASETFSFNDVVPVGYGITLKDGSHDDYANIDVEGKAVLIKQFAPETGDSSDIKYDDYSSNDDKIFRAIQAKAAAVFIYTPPNHDDTIAFRGGFANIAEKEIPIVWIKRAGLKALGLDLDNPVITSIEGQVALHRVIDTGYNVLARIPSDNDTTVIVGAHFDHLGWGGPESMYKGKEKKIHPGADDNGSGTAAILELARSLKSSPEPLRYTYLIAAFTGEEKGLIGSSHLAKMIEKDSIPLRMMVNLDMIGRLKEQAGGLAVFGTGTCPEFKNYFDSVHVDGMKIATKEEGIGASDHTSFYALERPVMHFFTGAHEDYHTPADVVSRLDIYGIVKVADFVDSILLYFDRLREPLEFRKRRGGGPGRGRGSFSVTLGVMPDHVADVKGLKIGAVTADGAAERAGIMKGDIVIKMGIRPIDDIYAYMNALGKYQKGDTTTVVVVRDTDTLSLLVEFK